MPIRNDGPDNIIRFYPGQKDNNIKVTQEDLNRGFLSTYVNLETGKGNDTVTVSNIQGITIKDSTGQEVPRTFVRVDGGEGQDKVNIQGPVSNAIINVSNVESISVSGKVENTVIVGNLSGSTVNIQGDFSGSVTINGNNTSITLPTGSRDDGGGNYTTPGPDGELDTPDDGHVSITPAPPASGNNVSIAQPLNNSTISPN